MLRIIHEVVTLCKEMCEEGFCLDTGTTEENLEKLSNKTEIFAFNFHSHLIYY